MNFLCTVLLHMTTFTLAMDDNPPEHEVRYKPITFVKPNGKNALQRGAKQDRTLNMVNDIMTKCIGRIDFTLRFCSPLCQHDKIQNRVIYTETTKNCLLKVFCESFAENFESYLSFIHENIATFYRTEKESELEINVIKICEMTEKAVCLQTIIHEMFRSVYSGMFHDLKSFYNFKDILYTHTDNCKKKYSEIKKVRKISQEQYDSLLKKLNTYAKSINDLVEFLEQRKKPLIRFMDGDKNCQRTNLLAFVQHGTGRMAETRQYAKQIGASNPSVNDSLSTEDGKFNVFSAQLDVTAAKDLESEIKDRNPINETATDQIVSTDDVKPALIDETNCNTMQPHSMQDCTSEIHENESDDTRSHDRREDVALGQTTEAGGLSSVEYEQFYGLAKQLFSLQNTGEMYSGCLEDLLTPYEGSEGFNPVNSLADASDRAPASLEDASNSIGLTHEEQKHHTPIQPKRVNNNTITRPDVTPNNFGCNPHGGPGHPAIPQPMCWNNRKLTQPDIVADNTIHPHHPHHSCLYQAVPLHTGYHPSPHNNPLYTRNYFPLPQYRTPPPPIVYATAQRPQFNPGALNNTRPPLNTRKHAQKSNIQGQAFTQHGNVISTNINPSDERNNLIPTQVERKLIQGHSSHSGIGYGASESYIGTKWNQQMDEIDGSMPNQEAPTLGDNIWRPTKKEKEKLEKRNYLASRR